MHQFTYFSCKQSLTNLEWVVFPAYEYPGSIYNVYGDISALKNCTKLVSVSLTNNSITGDVSVFATLPALISFNIQRTNVYGDLSSLKTYKGYYIAISHTQVTGDIANLSNMNDKYPYPEIYSIFSKYGGPNYPYQPASYVYQPLDVTLMYTSCYGNVSVFANKDIVRLQVNNTNVSGDASSLNNLPNLTTFNYANSKVTGTWTRAS